MQWNLTHQRDDQSVPEVAVIEADSAGQAIEVLRGQLPEGHQVLYVIRAEYAGLD